MSTEREKLPSATSLWYKTLQPQQPGKTVPLTTSQKRSDKSILGSKTPCQPVLAVDDAAVNRRRSKFNHETCREVEVTPEGARLNGIGHDVARHHGHLCATGSSRRGLSRGLRFVTVSEAARRRRRHYRAATEGCLGQFLVLLFVTGTIGGMHLVVGPGTTK
jgi:hypothetical protein